MMNWKVTALAMIVSAACVAAVQADLSVTTADGNGADTYVSKIERLASE